MTATAKVFRSGNSQAVRLRAREFSRKFWSTLGTLREFERPKQVRQRRSGTSTA